MFNLQQLIKNIFTILIVFFSADVRLHSLLNNPIFDSAQTKVFYFSKQEFKTTKMKGFILSNKNSIPIFEPSDDRIETSLYDLYLGFDNNDFIDNYKIIDSHYELNKKQKITGSASAKFISKENSIILFPYKNSILQKHTSNLQSFTISFSLYPYRYGEGIQTVVEYLGSNNKNSIQDEYGFKITIEKGIVHYHFINFFKDEKQMHYNFILKEKEPLINKIWERHTVVVDAVTKTIKVYRNGAENDVVILTDNQKIMGKRLLPSHLLSDSENLFPLIIGKNGLFSLDEFAIYRDIVTNHIIYEPNKLHFFETDTFKISNNYSYIHKMDLESSSNKNYRIAYRISKTYFLPETTSDDMPWIYINLSKKYFPPSHSIGKYLQWRIEYYDPSIPEKDKDYIKDIVLYFREFISPGKVEINSIVAGDEEIQINWKSLPYKLIKSYEIYYGTSSKNYFGSSNISSSSPIKIDVKSSSVSIPLSFIIQGLENEKEYFISIRAKDIYDQYSEYSEEISAKPSATNNKFGYSIGR